MRQQVIAQIGGTCPIVIFPTHGAHTIFRMDWQPEGGNIRGEDFAAFRHTMPERTVEVEKHCFDMIGKHGSYGIADDVPRQGVLIFYQTKLKRF
jgi:hypothetical protein